MKKYAAHKNGFVVLILCLYCNLCDVMVTQHTTVVSILSGLIMLVKLRGRLGGRSKSLQEL